MQGTNSEYGFSTSSERASGRADRLLSSLQIRQLVQLEKRRDDQLMLDEYLSRMDARYHTLAERISSIDEVQGFKDIAGSGRVNDNEFSVMVGAVFSRLVKAEALEFNDNGMRYAQSGSDGMHERKHGHPWAVEVEASGEDRRHDLKPDFFTARVCDVAGDWAPVSLSTMMHGLDPMEQQPVPPSERIAAGTGRGGEASSPPAVITSASEYFTWDDLSTLWEVKSSADDATCALSNLILKATETLRFQWQRHFLLAFLVCGTSLRMVRCERSCVLVGASVDFGGDAQVLVKCLVAGFVVDRAVDVGLLVDDRTVEMVDVDGKPRVVVGVDGQDFILGDQIIGPWRDHLASRATTVHLARKSGDTDWEYCFKCAWPYTTRPHEGVVLDVLQDIPGVVKMLAWDAPSVPGMWSMTSERIERDFRPQRVATSGRQTPSKTTSLPISSVSQEKLPMRVEDTVAGEGDTIAGKEDTAAGNEDTAAGNGESVAGNGETVAGKEDTVTGKEDTVADNEDTVAGNEEDAPGFRPRQFRRTVTLYIKDSFARVHDQLTARELLEIWRELYIITNSISHKGYVHRDLSWVNVRLHRTPSHTWSPILIDFDLASPIDGPASCAPDKTGTVVFMSIRILYHSGHEPVRHQELHEDEVVFWIVFLAIISRAESGRAEADELADEALPLRILGCEKLAMVSMYCADLSWDKWFGEMGAEGPILKKCCRRFVDLFFSKRFPGPGEVDEAGTRKHLVMHNRLVGDIMRVLENSIAELGEERIGE
ncbi:MAG: hypothetical protein M1813_005399 [Trichoglossum hirsutum]|nr:MAG: hypothetical protein M1813_005399 [Trichoglossum hirsutum]